MGLRKQLKKKKHRTKNKKQQKPKQKEILKKDQTNKKIQKNTKNNHEDEIFYDKKQSVYIKKDLFKTILTTIFIICLLFGFYFLLK